MYFPLDFGFSMKPIPFLTWTLFSFRRLSDVLQVLRHYRPTKPIQLQYTTIQYQITTNLDIFFECCLKNTDHLRGGVTRERTACGMHTRAEKKRMTIAIK
jgi:hypothetical protein